MEAFRSLINKISNTEDPTRIRELILDGFKNYPYIVKGFAETMDNWGSLDDEDFQQEILNLLNVINNFDDSQIEALELACDDQGPWYFDDTVDVINRGDYIYYPGVDNDYDLGVANINMFGSIEEAVDKSRIPMYIDYDELAEMLYNNATEDEEDLELNDFKQLAYELVANDPEYYAEDFFDYKAWGRDIRMGYGYYYGDTGAIVIL